MSPRTIIMSLAALLVLSLGLPETAGAQANAAAPQADALAWRLVADVQWERARVVRYADEVEGPVEAEPAPTFRSGSTAPTETVAPEPAPLVTLSEIGGAPVPATRPGRAGSWLEVVAPAERDLGLFLAAQAALLVDLAQTLEISRAAEFEETNAVLGERPTDGAVMAYFGSIAAVHAVSYLALEPRWANVVSRAILFVQVPAVDHNARLGVRIAF